MVWGLAEVLVARLRLVLPGILLASAFVVLVFAASVQVPVEVRLGSDIVAAADAAAAEPAAGACSTTPAGRSCSRRGRWSPTAAAAAFYWRFKLPFALLPLAASLVIAALGVASFLVPHAPAVADTVVLLVCGLGVFAAAMSFDASDRERLTRRADCAFWLHLLAAPLIVHSVI